MASLSYSFYGRTSLFDIYITPGYTTMVEGRGFDEALGWYGLAAPAVLDHMGQ
jgi:hypothetical protein